MKCVVVRLYNVEYPLFQLDISKKDLQNVSDALTCELTYNKVSLEELYNESSKSMS